MFKSQFPLITDRHINAAMFNRTPVVASHEGEELDNGGTIEKNDRHTVKINGMYYVKSVGQFKIR
ncbi:hypothetical protein [Paenibacillus sp. L3-i20]|uniref:hypothetical protein n=1 Tax=Paenibacillus sp. L3-i20 TaxID=2905833 RepID=UPI001EDF0AEC|nr:hypothetical protein [Paenibacillus sp. L3-i20]GKU80184.1 hypothetical protein L3i20_v245810 [Paenibacillus sp. L3-i20]